MRGQVFNDLLLEACLEFDPNAFALGDEHLQTLLRFCIGVHGDRLRCRWLEWLSDVAPPLQKTSSFPRRRVSSVRLPNLCRLDSRLYGYDGEERLLAGFRRVRKSLSPWVARSAPFSSNSAIQ